MIYDAITLDTNVFSQNSNRLDGGRLLQLRQFADSAHVFVLSDIVVRELETHLIKDIKSAQERLNSALREANEIGLLRDEKDISGFNPSKLQAVEVASEKIKSFISETGCEIVPALTVDVKAVLDRYFGAVAPFGSAKKKNEFPDAIALLTLEAWAESNNKRLLAVSADADWAAFCKGSGWITVTSDLAVALEEIQAEAEKAAEIVSDLLRRYCAGELPSLKKDFQKRLGLAFAALEVAVDGNSQFQFSENWVSVFLKEFEFESVENEFEFRTLNIDGDAIVVEIDIVAYVTVEADFSFSYYDSEEKEYHPVGSAYVSRERELHLPIIVTFEGNFSRPNEMHAAEIEIADTSVRIHFGSIEPDFGIDNDDR